MGRDSSRAWDNPFSFKEPWARHTNAHIPAGSEGELIEIAELLLNTELTLVH